MDRDPVGGSTDGGAVHDPFTRQARYELLVVVPGTGPRAPRAYRTVRPGTAI